MAAIHDLREPTVTRCGRDATAVQVGTPPTCRTCVRLVPPPTPDQLDVALEHADHVTGADQVTVAVLRRVLRDLESDNLEPAAVAQLSGRALQLLAALKLTPNARGAAPAPTSATVTPLEAARARAAARITDATGRDTTA